jgi:hypothetical protein
MEVQLDERGDAIYLYITGTSGLSEIMINGRKVRVYLNSTVSGGQPSAEISRIRENRKRGTS